MPSARALTDDEVAILLAAATHAPSMHNTQPWRFEIDGPVVDVLLDAERTLPAEDPAGRMVRIGLGAATLNLRVAAAMLGYETTYAMTPDPTRPEIVARIFLADHQVAVPGLGSLYGELRRRHTYRGPMTAHELSPRVLARLEHAVRSEGAELHLLDHDQCSALGGILHEADQLDLADEDRLHEGARWIGGDRDGDGVPDAAVGPLAARPAAIRDLAAGFERDHRSEAVFENRPLIMVLSSPDEDERSWLQAGQALQRLLLTATSYGLAASFLNQALEHPLQRTKVRELIGGRQWPQMILRMGHPARDTGRTSRHDWQQTLDYRD